MSYRSAQLSERSRPNAASHPHHHRAPPQARPTPPPPHHHKGAHASDYTLVHAGKRVRVGPVVFWIVTGSVILMGAWSAATATYFAFRDDVLTRLVARQAEMQYAYEDRIAELRAQIDRTTSRQLLDQEQFEQKLLQIQQRQISLEQRTSALGTLPDADAARAPGRGAALIDPVTTGSIDTASANPGPIKASGAGDTVFFQTPSDRETRRKSRITALAGLKPGDLSKKPGSLGTVLTRLQLSLDGVESRQMAALAALEDSFETRTRRMRGVFADLGLNEAQLKAGAAAAGIGGPFVPVQPPRGAGAFEQKLYRINVSRAEVERLSRTLAAVPYRKPLIGQIEFSSTFGVRSDPFLGRPAMHTGIDFRAATGDPVRATAQGKVVAAGWHGGYGRMIEIDHGNSLTTRYGHLSAIGVKVGDVVRIGQVIGAVGSTGRSTGPHLHYETRIDGDPVDPRKFLRAGLRLGTGERG
jgi:murein DD-endopeptidase MepM/ murein hydrolase activator NlpD